MRLFLFHLCLVLVIFEPIQAQENQKLDSILNVYGSQTEGVEKVKTIQELFYATIYNTPEQAKKYAHEGISLSKKINYSSGEGIGYYHLGTYYQITSKLDSALYYYEKSAAFWKATGDIERYATTVSSKGSLESMNGNYSAALEMFDEAIQSYKSVGNYSHMANTIGAKADCYIDQAKYRLALIDALKCMQIHDSLNIKPWRIADAKRRIGQIEGKLENHQKSLIYYHNALELYESINDVVFMGHTYNDIGLSHYAMDQYGKAIVFFEKSLNIGEEKGIEEMKGSALSNIGMAYSRSGNYKKAIAKLEQALKINKVSNTRNNYINNLNELGKALQLSGKTQESLKYLNLAVTKADSIKANNQLLSAYDYRAITHEELGAYEESISDLKHFKVLNDSIFNSTKSQQIEELRTIYETEKKEQQIALLEQEAKVSKLQKYLLGGGLGLSVLVFGFGFYGIRQKLKRNKAEKAKVDAELEFKKKELTTHALHLAKKNEVLESLKQKAEALKKEESVASGYQSLIRSIDFDLQDDNNWKNFSRYFEEVHSDFNSNVKARFPEVTSNELRLLALLKMNLSSKEIANILNISNEGIKKARYRLRKKLNIATEDSLQDLVLSL